MLLFIITIIVLTVIKASKSSWFLPLMAEMALVQSSYFLTVLKINRDGYMNIYVNVGIFELKDAYYFMHGTLNIAFM